MYCRVTTHRRSVSRFLWLETFQWSTLLLKWQYLFLFRQIWINNGQRKALERYHTGRLGWIYWKYNSSRLPLPHCKRKALDGKVVSALLILLSLLPINYWKIVKLQGNFLFRFLWTVIHILAIVFAVYNIHGVYKDFMTSPTVTTIDSTTYPVWNMPFPAVSICSFNRISRKAGTDFARNMCVACLWQIPFQKCGVVISIKLLCFIILTGKSQEIRKGGGMKNKYEARIIGLIL